VTNQQLVPSSGNGEGHINKVKTCRAWLVLGSVTFGGSTIPVFIHLTQPGHPSMGRMQGVLAMASDTAGKKTVDHRSGKGQGKSAGQRPTDVLTTVLCCQQPRKGWTVAGDRPGRKDYGEQTARRGSCLKRRNSSCSTTVLRHVSVSVARFPARTRSTFSVAASASLGSPGPDFSCGSPPACL